MIHLLPFGWTTVLLSTVHHQQSPSQAAQSSEPTFTPTTSLPKHYLGVHANPPSSTPAITDRQWILMAFGLAFILSIPYFITVLITYLQNRLWRPAAGIIPVLSPMESRNQTANLPDNVSWTKRRSNKRRVRTPSPPETTVEQGWRRILFGEDAPSMPSNGILLEASRRKRRAASQASRVGFIGGLDGFAESEGVEGSSEPRRVLSGAPAGWKEDKEEATEEAEAEEEAKEWEESTTEEDETWMKEWGWPSSSDDDLSDCGRPGSGKADSDAPLTPSATRMTPTSRELGVARASSSSPRQMDIEDAVANFVLSTDIPAPRRRQLREDYMDSLLKCPRHYRVADYRTSRATSKGKTRSKDQEE